MRNRRYYRIAGITIQVDSDLPISDNTFEERFRAFEAPGPGKDNIKIRHHFFLPDLEGKNLGKEVYCRPPWQIYRNGGWVYLGISPRLQERRLHRVAVFNADYSRGRLYNQNDAVFKKGNLPSLTLFPTDQILLAQLLARRQGCYLHSCGVNLQGKGLLFVGHSGAGKSTLCKMLKGRAEILCDDRIIVRRGGQEFRIYGTWSHGEVPEVSAGSAPLKAVFFLQKSKRNRIVRLNDKKEIIRRLLPCLIRPLVTQQWWERTLAVAEEIAGRAACFVLEFDRSGKAVDLLEKAGTQAR